ncbi:MAG TPA: hypothetical protein DEE98_01850 [Elusimicrobia bacterium]|nr:MAG: hypothetical protein A2278_05650 [Elusimicrobia bacterium RIFOXYA12_FULL_49_49]OGS09603.1 MAG: hypothetical protein A2204_00855 [Elusimicrobia bacterium RIFOXYA1_FULL_47_7]OGS11353.1 MAG: hypothetical protein A2386_07750 [Elusimicrobia bacterium RIFOXYB1_FULL_48_9]OGS15392.1 MAG: hypothetical protein A2251_07480 [Elusimicrobia bacterium RIFOXYA2_FULL_47_53]OGS26268.1 MAG: hypothetical protein A2339_01580 [Elusimicrobia bacterium RIFOXYB12_FULL_50_12]OGS30820.1 MAG: hypothetical protein
MSKITITSGLGHGNLGDDAILISNKRTFLDNGITDIAVLSPDPDKARKLYDGNILPNLGRLFKEINKGQFAWSWRLSQAFYVLFIIKMIINALRMSKNKSPVWVSESEREFLINIHSSDAFVVCGGGTFTDHYYYYHIASELLIAKALGKKCFLGAQSIGPLRGGWSFMMLRRVFRDTFITVRDNLFSREYLTGKVRVRNAQIKDCVDDAFLLESAEKGTVREILKGEGICPDNIAKYGKIVAFNARAWWKEKGQNQHLKEMLIKLLKELNAKKCYILFISMAKAGDNVSQDADNGLELISEAGMSNNNNIGILRKLHSPQEIKALIGMADLAIGVSYHFNLFAITQCIPTIGIYQDEYYKLKTLGLHNVFNNDKYAFDAGESYDKLIRLVNEADEQKEYITPDRIKALSVNCCVAAKMAARYAKEGG